MNFRDLQYFVAVAENNHFGRAADQCFVSQPTLSMQLKKLEQELDIQLFERDKKQVRLTDAGRKILSQAETVLREMQALKAAAKLASDPLSGDFKVGVIPTVAPYLFPHIVSEMKKRFPRIHFHIIEQQTRYLLEALQKGKLDVLLLALPFQQQDYFESRPLFKELFYFVLPLQHRLAKEKKIGTDQIDVQELLLLDDGHCLREQALEICGPQYRTELRAPNFSATSLETLKHMVILGNGVTLMPELSLQLVNHDLLVKQFRDPAPYRTIGLVWRSSSCHGVLVQQFGDFIMDEIKDKLKLKL